MIDIPLTDLLGLIDRANAFGALGAAIEPGHIVITWACAHPQRIEADNKVASAEFTRLGAVSAVIGD